MNTLPINTSSENRQFANFYILSKLHIEQQPLRVKYINILYACPHTIVNIKVQSKQILYRLITATFQMQTANTINNTIKYKQYCPAKRITPNFIRLWTIKNPITKTLAHSHTYAGLNFEHIHLYFPIKID